MATAKKPDITEVRKRKFADQIGRDAPPNGDGVVADNYFDTYFGDQSYEEGFDGAFNAKYVVDLIKAIWRRQSPYKLLDCGSANGLTLKEFDKFGVEAWGIENSAYIQSKTPDEWRERNLLGDVCKIPFEDNSFDFIYVTCLPHLPEEKIAQAVSEMFRVCRTGVIFHGVTTDMTEEVIADFEMFAGLQTFWTFSEWADVMIRAGFQFAVTDAKLLDEVWEIEQGVEGDDWDWYPDKETMKYSYFSKPKVKPR